MAHLENNYIFQMINYNIIHSDIYFVQQQSCKTTLQLRTHIQLILGALPVTETALTPMYASAGQTKPQHLDISMIPVFTFMHLADAFIQSDLQLHSVYTFSLVCVFPGNRTHNLLRC